MRLFSGRRAGSLLRNAGWVKLVCLCLAGGLANSVQAQPANNNFASATHLAGASGTISGSNVLATLEPPCETNQIYVQDYGQVELVGASVWYAWTAPAAGIAHFSTVGSDFDTVLSVWTTSGGLCSSTLTNLVADDDSGDNTPGGTSALSFPAAAGKTYYICVEGFDYGTSKNPAPAEGNVVLGWQESIATVPSGYFTFATSQAPDASGTPVFVASEYDSTYSTAESVAGARVTVTRTNGYNGRVLVDYAVGQLTYTNIYRTNYFGTNIVTTSVATNGTFITNFTFTTIYVSNTFGSYNLGYQTYSTTNAYTNITTVITVLGANGLPLPGYPLTITGPTLTLQPVPTNVPPFNLTSNTNYLPPLPPFNSVTNISIITLDTNGTTFTNLTISTTNIFVLPSVVTNVVVISGGGIGPASGTLAFDDFQMSQDVIVPVNLVPGANNIYPPVSPPSGCRTRGWIPWSRPI